MLATRATSALVTSLSARRLAVASSSRPTTLVRRACLTTATVGSRTANAGSGSSSSQAAARGVAVVAALVAGWTVLPCSSPEKVSACDTAWGRPPRGMQMEGADDFVCVRVLVRAPPEDCAHLNPP
jgi:hypothetical protein